MNLKVNFQVLERINKPFQDAMASVGEKEDGSKVLSQLSVDEGGAVSATFQIFKTFFILLFFQNNFLFDLISLIF